MSSLKAVDSCHQNVHPHDQNQYHDHEHCDCHYQVRRNARLVLFKFDSFSQDQHAMYQYLDDYDNYDGWHVYVMTIRFWKEYRFLCQDIRCRLVVPALLPITSVLQRSSLIKRSLIFVDKSFDDTPFHASQLVLPVQSLLDAMKTISSVFRTLCPTEFGSCACPIRM